MIIDVLLEANKGKHHKTRSKLHVYHGTYLKLKVEDIDLSKCRDNLYRVNS